MATIHTSLNRDSYQVSDGLESKVIVNALADIPGGRTLDVSGMPAGTTAVKAGHIIITDADGVAKPMPVSADGTAYAALPEGASYLGVLKATVPTADARAAIVTAGQVNRAASPYPVTDAIKQGLPLVQFLY